MPNTSKLEVTESVSFHSHFQERFQFQFQFQFQIQIQFQVMLHIVAHNTHVAHIAHYGVGSSCMRGLLPGIRAFILYIKAERSSSF